MADWIIEPQFVRVTASPDSTREEILEAITAAAKAPRFQRGSGLLLWVLRLLPLCMRSIRLLWA